MNPLRSLCLLACLLAAVCATPSHSRGNSLSNKLHPTEWLSVSELESLPTMDDVSWEKLERMSAEEGANLVNKIYHLSQISRDIEPTFTPSANDIPAYIVTPNSPKVSFKLDQLVSKAKQQSNFGNEEVTILITGLPQQSEHVAKANRNLVQAYVQRYTKQQQQQQEQQQQQKQKKQDNQNSQGSSSEEDSKSQEQSGQEQWATGNLVVIDLGATLTKFERLAMLDIDRTGALIASILNQLTNEVDVPEEIIHLIGQGVGAHVAGVAGRQFTRLTGHQLRRITGLDPSKIYAKYPNKLNGLARGDAEFVDAIHTSAYGMGTTTRVGDVDFYPNGPSVAAPGTDNIVEASMRATRYFAESVRPGNERNFPAVAATSLKQYKNNNGYGPRAYMGIDTDFDVEGDYVLQVNSKSPFGKSAPARRQNNYHSVHQAWNAQSQKN